VVGPRQTHGVAYDFVRRLLRDPTTLSILGDGNQSKSYVHVDDVVAALRFVAGRGMDGFGYYNVATQDYVTVRQIADMCCEELGLTGVRYAFAGGDRGWKGDVPVVRFDTGKLRALGPTGGRLSRRCGTRSGPSSPTRRPGGSISRCRHPQGDRGSVRPVRGLAPVGWRSRKRRDFPRRARSRVNRT
jgi:hypothetical protein